MDVFPYDEKQLQKFAQEVGKQAKNPPGGDAIIGGLFQAVSEELETNSPLLSPVKDMVAIRTETEVSSQVGILRAAIQYDALHYQQDFPNSSYREKQGYRPLLDALNQSLEMGDERSEEFRTHLLASEVQTNIYQRYGPIELVMQLYADRFSNGIEWLDVGSGINQGIHALVDKSTYFQDPIHVMGPVSPKSPGDKLEIVQDDEMTERINELMKRVSLLKTAYGVDLHKAYIPETIQWSRASLRPEKELMDAKFMKKFNTLARTAPPKNVQFMPVDFSDSRDIAKFERKYPEQKFDIISFATVLHQVDKTELHSMLDNAVEYIKPDGLIVVQDFAWKNKSIRFYRHWHVPYRYRTFVLDMAYADIGWQEVFASKDSRCGDIQLGLGGLMVRGKFKSVTEAVSLA